MKTKFLLLSLLLAASQLTFGQSFIWEAFDAGQMPPQGWTINGLPAQWAAANSAIAGGSAPEGKFTYIQQTTTTRLISPMIDLTGLTTVKFSFRHMYDYYGNPAPKVGVATRSHNGAWTSVYEVLPTSNIPAQQINLDITNTDVGQSEFQICIYLNGNMYNLDYYYVDDILLFNPLEKDGAMISLGSTASYFAEPVEVKGRIMNVGLSTITEAEVQWQLDSGPVFSSTFSGLAIGTKQTYDFTCTDLLSALIGPHSLKVWIKNINGTPDNYLGNDTLQKLVNKVCYVVPAKPLFEEFTSSTCAPCASFNSGFVPWCATNEEDITLVKYQMSWPSPGDPYYTAEGGVRKDFYGVNAVPDLYCNGGNVATSVDDVQTAFDQANMQIGMMKIASSHSLNGHIITVDASVLPFYNFPNCRVYIVVMEKITHNNHMTNGETSFEHVMMKMIPDAQGTAVDLVDRVPFNITETVDLTGTHVEEWNDLIVGVFVQNYQTKAVYQSAYSLENGAYASEARLVSMDLDGNPVTGFSPDDFSYTFKLQPDIISVPDISALPIDPNATTIIVPAIELPGTTTIDVFGEDLLSHNLYSIDFEYSGVGIKTVKEQAIDVYPNPTRGLVYLMNADHARISVFSSNGTLQRVFPDFTGNSVDLKQLTPGIYTLEIAKPGFTKIRKKIVVQ
jgi:hypothetical protein